MFMGHRCSWPGLSTVQNPREGASHPPGPAVTSPAHPTTWLCASASPGPWECTVPAGDRLTRGLRGQHGIPSSLCSATIANQRQTQQWSLQLRGTKGGATAMPGPVQEVYGRWPGLSSWMVLQWVPFSCLCGTDTTPCWQCQAASASSRCPLGPPSSSRPCPAQAGVTGM